MASEKALVTKKVAIEGEFINLGQFLKFQGIIEQGGEAKSFLLEENVLVNGESETRRGRKLRPGDQVEIQGIRYEITL